MTMAKIESGSGTGGLNEACDCCFDFAFNSCCESNTIFVLKEMQRTELDCNGCESVSFGF